MPRIEITISIPEDPARGTLHTVIEGPNPDKVAKSAFDLISFMTRPEEGKWLSTH